MMSRATITIRNYEQLTKIQRELDESFSRLSNRGHYELANYIGDALYMVRKVRAELYAEYFKAYHEKEAGE